jgi:GNAT superfamily N-acetyltransferase
LPLTLRQATCDERDVILDLIEDTVRWLRSRGIDQWSKPWPDEERRDKRISQDLSEGKTWLALDGTAVAGTITVDPADNDIWPTEKRGEKAVYVRRVIVGRRYAGLGLGARLLDWASDIGARVHEARWIRIDVWTTNRRLHAYYRTQGFRFSGLRDLDDDPDYPSRALFERSTDRRRRDYLALLKPSGPPSTAPLPVTVEVTIELRRPRRLRERTGVVVHDRHDPDIRSGHQRTGVMRVEPAVEEDQVPGLRAEH